MIQRFPDNSRVVFIGDSITAENLTLQHIIRAYKDIGAANIRFFNCGVAGGTADFAVTSYFKDIKRYSPTHAVVSFGINDSKRELLCENRSGERLGAMLRAFELYKARMAELVDLLLSDGVDVTLCTPVPYDEYSQSSEEALPGGYALMLGYAEYVRNLAKEKGVALYDQHRIISSLMAEDQIHSPDRIHPSYHGYYVLAREFLKEQRIDIDANEELPSYFYLWHSYVARLRKLLATECMLVPKLGLNFDSPAENKIAAMRVKVEKEDWGQPVFESFCRAYVADKATEDELYRLVDETYENKVI